MSKTGNQSVSGLTDDELAKIRTLKGLIQAECSAKTISNRGAVVWAVENELERMQE